MSTVQIEEPPFRNALINGPTDPVMTPPWIRWFTLVLLGRVQQSPAQVTAPVALAAQSGSLGLTELVPSASGLYRVHLYGRIVQAATASSALTVTLTTTDAAGTVTTTILPTETGNSTSKGLFGTAIVRCDEGSVLSYSTTYVSVGATVMKYDLALTVEGLSV